MERFAAEHNARGDDDPVELRVARAQSGASNLLWIMRKAKKRALREGLGE